MNNTWYIGERVRTYCWHCGELFRTTVCNANGNHKNDYCAKCRRAVKKVESWSELEALET